MLPAHLPALAGIVIPAALIFCFRNDGRNLNAPSAGVDGHECQVGGTHVLAIVEDVVFYPGLYPHLHRTAEHTVYRGPEDDQIPNVYRNPEIHMVNRRRNYIVSGVAMSGHGSGEVDPMHKASAEQGAERVGIVG